MDMKYFYVIKEYLQVAGQCLAYIYKFDKKGTAGRIIILLVFPLIANVLNIANAHLADAMQKSYGSGMMQVLLPIFFVVLSIELLDSIFRYLNRRIQWAWNSKLRITIEVERQRKKAQFSLPFIDSEDYEKLNQRIQYSGDGFNSQLTLLNSIPDFLRICINSVFSLYIVFTFNAWFAVILFITTLPKFAISFTQSFALRKLFEKHIPYQRQTGVYGNQFSNYTNLKDTKISGSISSILDIYVQRREYYQNLKYDVFIKYLNLNFIANLLGFCIAFILQYFVIREVVFGTLLIGQATLIVMQIFKMQDSIIEFSNFLPDQYENIVSAKYLFLYLATEENIEKNNGDVVHTISAAKEKGVAIKLDNIYFTYPDIHFEGMRSLIKEIDSISDKFFGLKKDEVISPKKPNNFILTIPSLTINTGERVAIVGKNGNGKTTFLQLVLNLYKPEQGSVEIFGNVLQDMNQTDVEKYFSVLFQDYGQTNFRVDEYIGLSDIGNPNLDLVKQAAELATAKDFIEKWKDTYTQQLGISFGGVKPSKGQWQKLALARALYKDAPILVLDEPTSAIDALSAKKIFENLAKIDPNKTLLFVCHNMVDIPLTATRVLVFNEGKIVGDGSHEALLKTCTVYKELYESEIRK